MLLTLDNAVVYDEESFPNVFTIAAESLHGTERAVWEISDFRNDITALFQWLDYLASTNTPMIGFNNVGYDYPLLHFIRTYPGIITAELIYEKSMSIINSNDRFGHIIWDRDRLIPQIDLYKIHHFDNRAKTIGLKALQINMRSPTVVESTVPFGTILTEDQVHKDVIPYNLHDVQETKRFAHYSMDAIEFRIGLIEQFGIEALNFSDVKIGVKMLEKRLGDDVCYDRSSGRRRPRQTPRYRIPLRDIIFPYIKFENPEFQRIHTYMLDQVLAPEDITDPDAQIKTKGAISISANVGGLTFEFGTGGVHASVERQRFYSDEEYALMDIDVAALYPNVAIVNRLAPEHLGEAFIAEYAKIPAERNTHAKGTYENAALKLAANGPWGQSNNKFSIFFDPKYAMTIPVNGQLMICMLVEQLVKIPTLTLIQGNTDGITYRIRRDMLHHARAIEDWWEKFTCLTLERVEYNAMYIRDVNNYVAVCAKGTIKLKGAYWTPDSLDYTGSISKSSPPAWHKDLSNLVSIRAAVAAMVDGIDPETYIKCHTDPFDFMCRIRVNRNCKLIYGDEVIQSTTRYYVSTDGRPLAKISPPPAGFEIGMWKKAPRITNMEYHAVMRETGGEWDERVCTKSRSKYDNVKSNIQAGWLVTECNDANKFRFDNINYDWYIAEAKKLII